MKRPDSQWINVVAGVAGGIAFGWGIGQLVAGVTVAASAWVIIGLIVLWWAFVDRRKARRGTPESEMDGTHTIE
jgi:phage shock protein PspC (stress-responsive transcriptional regulator)